MRSLCLDIFEIMKDLTIRMTHDRWSFDCYNHFCRKCKVRTLRLLWDEVMHLRKSSVSGVRRVWLHSRWSWRLTRARELAWYSVFTWWITPMRNQGWEFKCSCNAAHYILHRFWDIFCVELLARSLCSAGRTSIYFAMVYSHCFAKLGVVYDWDKYIDIA